jgi:hypothetical protein
MMYTVERATRLTLYTLLTYIESRFAVDADRRIVQFSVKNLTVAQFHELQERLGPGFNLVYQGLTRGYDHLSVEALSPDPS